jgi:hypothetical protein
MDRLPSVRISSIKTASPLMCSVASRSRCGSCELSGNPSATVKTNHNASPLAVRNRSGRMLQIMRESRCRGEQKQNDYQSNSDQSASTRRTRREARDGRIKPAMRRPWRARRLHIGHSVVALRSTPPILTRIRTISQSGRRS